MIAVLFARRDSVYKSIPGLDVFDIDRDARTFAGGMPIIAHPPCRAWGRLRHMAKPLADEKQLALWAVDQIRRSGGVLEHPAASLLWAAAGLPQPGRRDEFGGWTLPIRQYWFGHRAMKSTLLYVVGCEPRAIPPFPMVLGEAPILVEHMNVRERERTPIAFAKWLVELAEKCHISSAPPVDGTPQAARADAGTFMEMEISGVPSLL